MADEDDWTDEIVDVVWENFPEPEEDAVDDGSVCGIAPVTMIETSDDKDVSLNMIVEDN